MESLETRQLLAADIWVGAVYLDPNDGTDVIGNTFTITWQGGAAGTQLSEIIIDTDKLGNGLTIGDAFFHTGPGGGGAFGYHPFQAIETAGFTITGVEVQNGGTLLRMTFDGWDAGEKLVFKIDVDEMGFLSANAVAEGNEFEGSRFTATFVSPDHQDATGTVIFYDAFDPIMAPSGLDLPPDSYMPPSSIPLPVYTAGTAMQLTQVPHPGSISGQVHVELNGDCIVQPGEPLLEGVEMQLLDSAGNVIAITYTDVEGRYTFDNLLPGTYSVRQIQPTGYLSGGAKAGTIGGTVSNSNLISNIDVGANEHGVNYDFCEYLPNSIAGRVYHDQNLNGTYDPSESPIAGVTLELRDAHGNLVATTQTNAQGEYRFDNLHRGTYTVYQIQPTGWLDGQESLGSLGGLIIDPDAIGSIVLVSDNHGIHYDFGEYLPGSISGRVHADTNGDCIWQPGEALLSGVEIHLLDAGGNVVAITYTNAQGQYSFNNLAPGTYGVREIQPEGYFDGGDRIGSAGGVKSANDEITQIVIGSGVMAVNYDFCEKPPASISGYVYQDGPTAYALAPTTTAAQRAAELYNQRNGLRTSDDTPIAGVRLLLLDGSGNPVLDGSGNPRVAITDANGYYHFGDLPEGTYQIVQIQPAGYYDGRDHAGSLGGMVDEPGNRIYNIMVGYGQHGVEYNFSELRVADSPLFIPPPRDPLPQPPPLNAPFELLVAPVYEPPALVWGVPEVARYSGGYMTGYTWHLSIVNAGRPRADRAVQFTALSEGHQDWENDRLDRAEWELRTERNGEQLTPRLIFGMPDGIPVVGDFNGDGTSEVGVYRDGQWFIDVNGNGTWDPSDLWAKLGTGEDLPVVGDWDGDGKTDIGIYGRAWPGDPRAVANEPGLPDPDNPRLGVTKNLPPDADVAPDGWRTMQLTSSGGVRADLIDHVFAYGTPGDRPIAGDWNGTGVDTIGVFRDGRWDLDMDGDGRFTENDRTFYYGQAGDLPVVGDFTGDGVDEVGVFRDGVWYIDLNRDGVLDEQDRFAEFGRAGDIPVVGDWNGDGIDEIGVYRPHVQP